MLNQRILCTETGLFFLLFGIFGPGAARAGFVTYDVSVVTSSLNGQGGYLDFQFNPGGSTAEFAKAVVFSFQTMGVILAAAATDTGDASGSLPGTLSLDNGTAYNDIFQGVTFGSSFNFELTLSGPALDSPGDTFGSSFAISLYAADGITPLLTTDPNGSVASINLNANGTTSVEIFPQSPTDDTPVASATPAASVVPVPSTIVLLTSTLPTCLIVWLHRRRRVRGHSDRGQEL